MAPIKDETVDNLKDLVSKLESRVAQLEARLSGDGGAAKASSMTESMRIILMGPPGAGMKRQLSGSSILLGSSC